MQAGFGDDPSPIDVLVTTANANVQARAPKAWTYTEVTIPSLLSVAVETSRLRENQVPQVLDLQCQQVEHRKSGRTIAGWLPRNQYTFCNQIHIPHTTHTRHTQHTTHTTCTTHTTPHAHPHMIPHTPHNPVRTFYRKPPALRTYMKNSRFQTVVIPFSPALAGFTDLVITNAHLNNVVAKEKPVPRESWFDRL